MRSVYPLVLLAAVAVANGGQPLTANAATPQAATPQAADEPASGESETAKQLYEVRRYVVGDKVDPAALDQYLGEVLLPALDRAGAGPVGLFGPAEGAESQDRFVIITYDRIAEIPQVREQLLSDSEFAEGTEKLEAGGPDDPPYARIQSELLLAMDVMPKAETSQESRTSPDRVYELRVYESANERLGERKVEMFNRGEVPIFLDSGIHPVFLGQAILGPHTPSLTYLTVYSDDAARQRAWKTFIAHPDWKKLSGDKYYEGTVSKIYKFVLRPLPQSQM